MPNLPLDILFRTSYSRQPKYLVPRICDETKQNFLIATLMQNGFVVEVHGDKATPSLSQSVALATALKSDITRRGTKPIKLKIELSKLKITGMVRSRLGVKVTRGTNDVIHYNFNHLGNQF